MIFEKIFKFSIIGLAALALFLLPGTSAMAQDMDSFQLDEKKVEEVLKDPEKAIKSIKNNPYDEKFNQSFGACAMTLFPPFNPALNGPPPKDYFIMDQRKIAAIRKCMSDKGYKGQDYGQDDVKTGSNPELDKNYKEMEESYERLDQAMKNLEEQRKRIAEHGAGAITPEDRKKFLVPLEEPEPSKVYRFDRQYSKDKQGGKK